jgi:hypothetical protein
MSSKSKKLSNAFSTGGGGPHFEAHVQASYVTLMLTGGCAPCLPCWPITEIKLQGKIDGFDTDDLVVFVQSPDRRERRKLLGQVKHALRVTKDNKIFGEVMKAAWDDFCAPKRFTKGKDKIAAISGALTSTDTEDVCWLLEQARCTKSPKEFLRNVNEANFSSNQKRKKLAAFRNHLKNANDGLDLSVAELHDFLRHFHLLGYDLGKEEGVVLSLLHSHISQFNSDYPRMVWGRIVDIVQTWNQNAGTITRGNLPEDLLNEFRRPVVQAIPEEIVRRPPLPPLDLCAQAYARDLGVAFLLGGWNEGTEGDIRIAAQLANAEYDKWIASIREALEIPGSPLTLRNSTWTTKRNKESWEQLGKKIFDGDLDAFEKIAAEVLSERNPIFELPGDERYMASIKGKVLLHSSALREGIANALAVMGSYPKLFTHCSDSKAETVALLVVRRVLNEADWQLWGSLNNLLPLLAEAAPDEFLQAVENALQLDPCPFSTLFSEEGSGIMGNNYMTGLLWALETLAWDKQHLTRVAIILGELSVIDPGGNWSNRPANSLTTIFLPWLPQTTAPIERRLTAMRTLVKEVPDSAWSALINLLPNQHQISSGSHKPRWRQIIPDKASEGIPMKEYWDQVSCYAELALQMAGKDTDRLKKLVGAMDNLPPPVFDGLLGHLESDAIAGLPEKERTSLWSELMKFTVKHRRYADAKWALGEDVLERIDAVASSLAPENPSNLYSRLFSGSDFDLYEEDGDWRKQERRLNERRQEAISKIYAIDGIGGVIRFAESVQSPSHVGAALGALAGTDDDATILPTYLNNTSDAVSHFVSSYIWARHKNGGWDWVDQQLAESWEPERLARFLISLPFSSQAWTRVADHLGEDDSRYWTRVLFNPFQVDTDNGHVIDKFLENGRPNAAIDCLHAAQYNKQPLDHDRTIKALLAAVSSDDQTHSMDIYHAIELIKALQSDETTNQDDLLNVEWAYLTALDGHNGARPKLLEHRLATEPAFFCEIIRLIFRSRHEEQLPKEPTEKQRKIAGHAYKLLHEWNTPPGTSTDGSFSPGAFTKWLEEVRVTCGKSGHIEVALSQIGQVLIYSPVDPGGLWIDESIADALNAKNAEEMRSGYWTGVFNSRGVYWVDPTGQPEKDLAEKYKTQADDVEEAGYHRFSTTMRSLSDSYIREAERVIAEHRAEENLDAEDENAEEQG